MGVLSRAIGGAAKGAVTHFKQMGEEQRQARLRKDSREYDQLEWDRRNKSTRSYTEGQRDIQNEYTETVYQEHLKESRENKAKITEGEREHAAKLLREKHTYDAGVANSWWGSGSQKKFNEELKLLADRAYGDEYRETEDEVHKNSQEWRDDRTKYINKVKNELVEGGYKTIFDWEQQDSKPKTDTPTPTGTNPEFNEARHKAFIADFLRESSGGINVRLKDPQSGAESKNPADANNYQKEIANTMIEFLDIQPDKWDDKTRSGFASLGVKDHADLENLFWETTGIKAKVWRKYVQNK